MFLDKTSEKITVVIINFNVLTRSKDREGTRQQLERIED